MASGKPLGAIDDVASADADGTYGAEEQALINELKAQVNLLLGRMRERGWVDQ